MVSEWMPNGGTMDYVRGNAGDRLELVGYNRVVHCHCLPTSFNSRTPLKV